MLAVLAVIAALAVICFPAGLAHSVLALVALPVVICFPAMFAMLANIFALVREPACRGHRLLLAKHFAGCGGNARRAVHDGLALRFGHANMRSHGRGYEVPVV